MYTQLAAELDKIMAKQTEANSSIIMVAAINKLCAANKPFKDNTGTMYTIQSHKINEVKPGSNNGLLYRI